METYTIYKVIVPVFLNIIVEETAVKIGHYVESTNKGLAWNSNNILNNIGT